MAADPASRLRRLCLVLPDAEEVAMKRGPTYRIADKIFATDRVLDGRPSTWLKVPDGSQAILIGADAKRFFIPPYFGSKGWIGVWLDRKPDWKEVEALIRRSYRLIAPRRYAERLKD